MLQMATAHQDHGGQSDSRAPNYEPTPGQWPSSMLVLNFWEPGQLPIPGDSQTLTGH